MQSHRLDSVVTMGGRNCVTMENRPNMTADKRDGVGQIMPMEQHVSTGAGACMSVAELLRSLEFVAPTDN